MINSVLWHIRGKERKCIWPAVSLGTREGPLLLLLSVCEACRATHWQGKNWWGREETVSSIWAWQWRQECPRPEQPASLCCHVDNSPHATQPEESCHVGQWGLACPSHTLVLKGSHALTHKHVHAHTDIYCKHASHKRKLGWVSVIQYVLRQVINVENLFLVADLVSEKCIELFLNFSVLLWLIRLHYYLLFYSPDQV